MVFAQELAGRPDRSAGGGQLLVLDADPVQERLPGRVKGLCPLPLELISKGLGVDAGRVVRGGALPGGSFTLAPFVVVAAAAAPTAGAAVMGVALSTLPGPSVSEVLGPGRGTRRSAMILQGDPTVREHLGVLVV